MASTIEKVKDALHLNKHHGTTSTTGTTGTTHTAGTTHGTTHSGVGEGQAGPHSSRVANAADPRVDSDLDGRGAGVGSTGFGNNAGYGGTQTGNHLGSSTGTTGNTTHSTGVTGTGSTNAGPHSSNLANKMDPRVDSDLDGRAGGAGSTGYTGTTGNTTHGTGMDGAGTGTVGSTNAGPHSSNLANKMDPRVDSDMDGSRNMGAATHSGTTQTTTGTGYGGTHAGNNLGGNTGTTGGLSNSTNAGPHDSNLANKVDPRVDSDLDGRGNRHGAATGGIMGTAGSHATPGSGTAQNTAGPHNSDLANKLDPRVDADMDGSKTYGGNRTHADTHNLDASKVPPSVFAARKGEPEVLHGDHAHNHAGRHGIVVSN